MIGIRRNPHTAHAGNRLKSYRTARSAFPAVALYPAGPCRESGKTGVEWRDSKHRQYTSRRPQTSSNFPILPGQRRALPRYPWTENKLNRLVGLFGGDGDLLEPARQQVGRGGAPDQVVKMEILVLVQDHNA